MSSKKENTHHIINRPFEAYKGGEPYIFISYAHKDCDLVYPEITRLHRLGYRVWYDEGIELSLNWCEEVESALLNCAYFMVFMSPNAVDSKNVRDEIILALDENKCFLAVYLDETPLKYGLKLRMGAIQSLLKYGEVTEIYEKKLSDALPSEVLGHPPNINEPVNKIVDTDAEFARLVREGQELKNCGDHDGAVAKFREALKYKQNDAHVWYNIGDICDEQGKYEAAIKCYSRAITIDHNHVAALYGKGTCLYNIKKYEDALDCVVRVLEINPRHKKAADKKQALEKIINSRKSDSAILKNRFHKVIGIDLGTTYSVVSVFDNNKDAVVTVLNNYGKITTPSVVSSDKNNKILVGDHAKRNIPIKPDGTIIEVKRLMGKANKDYKDAHGNPLPLPACVVPGPPDASMKVKFLGRAFEPQFISAIILDDLKKAAEKFIGCPIHDAVISVPAYFTEVQRKATEDAARIAQLNPRLLINEPTAAAIAYSLEKFKDSEEKKTLLIYDLGGGTFDVSIITVDKGQISVVGTSGNDHLGGGDFDNDMTEWVINEIKRTENLDCSANKSVMKKIKAACEQTKRDLSAAESAAVDIAIPELAASIDITRVQFEQLIKHYLDETLKSIDEAFKSSSKQNDITINDLDMVILTGGSSRIPKVREIIRKKLVDGKGISEADADEMIKFDINSEEIVAMGAAIMARTMPPMDKFEGEVVNIEASGSEGAAEAPKIEIFDVSGHSLGIGIMRDPTTGSDYDRLTVKDTQIPCSVTKDGYTNAMDNQTTVEIPVYQGESPYCIENTKIGSVVIQLEPRPRGEHDFGVAFLIDINGLLSVAVLHMKAGQLVGKHEAKVICGTQRLSNDEIKNRQSELAAIMAGTMPGGRSSPSLNLPPSDVEIPQEYKIIYEQAVIKMNNSSGEKRAAIANAINEFKEALLIKDPGLIKIKNDTLVKAAFY